LGGDIELDDEASKQNIEPLQSLHHCSIGYQYVQHELSSPRRLIPTSAIENKARMKKMHSELWMND
jgi:hypothetical protein